MRVCVVRVLQEQAGAGDNPEWASVRDRAVLADAEGLLTCYGVGEESSAQLTHAVIELCYTSSVRFLQPGLLLQARPPHAPPLISSGDAPP